MLKQRAGRFGTTMYLLITAAAIGADVTATALIPKLTTLVK